MGCWQLPSGLALCGQHDGVLSVGIYQGLAITGAMSKDVAGLPRMASGINRRDSRVQEQGWKSHSGNDFLRELSLGTGSENPIFISLHQHLLEGGPRREEGKTGSSISLSLFLPPPLLKAWVGRDSPGDFSLRHEDPSHRVIPQLIPKQFFFS